jgi:hypothetical protein
MVKVRIDEQDYVSVEEARQMLNISPTEMATLLDAEALRSLKDRHDRSIRWILADDVNDAFLHLNVYRIEEKRRLSRPIGGSEKKGQAEPREVSYYTFADSDFATLLMALVSYFDAERDIYFGWQDGRDNITKIVDVVSKILLRLEEGSKAGRSISEIVEEIFHLRPDAKSRNEVFQYLMRKVGRDR